MIFWYKKINLFLKDKTCGPKLSFRERFHCIAYGEGVVLIIDVVRANEFLQDEIGIGTSLDPSRVQHTGKGWHARLYTIIFKRRVSACIG